MCKIHSALLLTSTSYHFINTKPCFFIFYSIDFESCMTIKFLFKNIFVNSLPAGKMLALVASQRKSRLKNLDMSTQNRLYSHVKYLLSFYLQRINSFLPLTDIAG